MDIINQTMFSADVMSDAARVGPAIGIAAHHVAKRARSPFMLPEFVPTPENRTFRQAQATIDNIVYGLIAERRREGNSHGDLLDMLLEARDEETGEGMDEKQLFDEVLGIFAAGHETTANALAWTWYALSQHPHVVEKLHHELDTVLEGRIPTVADLASLPYTQHIFNETLRLHPAVPFVVRRTPNPVTLGGYVIPADARVFLSIGAIHQHPDFWENPTVYDPDRWEGEAAKRRHGLAFMPFGSGPRICIGNNMALMEGQLLLAMVAQKYTLSLDPAHHVKRQVAITMRPKDGLPMLIERR